MKPKRFCNGAFTIIVKNICKVYTVTLSFGYRVYDFFCMLKLHVTQLYFMDKIIYTTVEIVIIV